MSNFDGLFNFVKVCEVFARAKKECVGRWVNYPIWLGYHVAVNDCGNALAPVWVPFTLGRLLQWLDRMWHDCVVAGWTSVFGRLRLIFVGIYFAHANSASRLETTSNEGIVLSFNRVLLFLLAWWLAQSWEFATQTLSANLSYRVIWGELLND